jgi:hypothetical protein
MDRKLLTIFSDSPLNELFFIFSKAIPSQTRPIQPNTTPNSKLVNQTSTSNMPSLRPGIVPPNSNGQRVPNQPPPSLMPARLNQQPPGTNPMNHHQLNSKVNNPPLVNPNSQPQQQQQQPFFINSHPNNSNNMNQMNKNQMNYNRPNVASNPAMHHHQKSYNPGFGNQANSNNLNGINNRVANVNMNPSSSGVNMGAGMMHQNKSLQSNAYMHNNRQSPFKQP